MLKKKNKKNKKEKKRTGRLMPPCKIVQGRAAALVTTATRRSQRGKKLADVKRGESGLMLHMHTEASELT